MQARKTCLVESIFISVPSQSSFQPVMDKVGFSLSKRRRRRMLFSSKGILWMICDRGGGGLWKNEGGVCSWRRPRALID